MRVSSSWGDAWGSIVGPSNGELFFFYMKADELDSPRCLCDAKVLSYPGYSSLDCWFGFGVEPLVLAEGNWETEPPNHQLEGS